MYWFEGAPHEVFTLPELLRIGFMSRDFADAAENTRDRFAYELAAARRDGTPLGLDVPDGARVSDAMLAFTSARFRTVVETLTGTAFETPDEVIARVEREGLPDPGPRGLPLAAFNPRARRRRPSKAKKATKAYRPKRRT